MNASRLFLRKQCSGASSVGIKNTFVSVSQIVKQERLICRTNSVLVDCQRKFSSAEKPSNERKSLVHGEPSKEIKQLSDEILNLNAIDMNILLEILQVGVILFNGGNCKLKSAYCSL